MGLISWIKEKLQMAWYALWKWYSLWSKRDCPNMIHWYSEYVLKTPEQREHEHIEKKKRANTILAQFGIMNMMCEEVSPHYARWYQ